MWSLDCSDTWADACIKPVEREVGRSRALLFNIPDCEEVDSRDVAELAPFLFDAVRRRRKTQNRGRSVYIGASSAYGSVVKLRNLTYTHVLT